MSNVLNKKSLRMNCICSSVVFADPSLVDVGYAVLAVFVILKAEEVVIVIIDDAPFLGDAFVSAVFAFPFIACPCVEGPAVFTSVVSLAHVVLAAVWAFELVFILINLISA